MSNSEQSAERRDGNVPLDSGDDGQAELKAMLDTIAHQMRDADARHMAALNDMQSRISGMEREADAMRPRVPDQFAPAFEQIEIAIGQLAHRLADTGSATHRDMRATAQPERKAPGHSGLADGPDAVKSVPGDALDPWDQEAADALAGLYAPGDKTFSSADTPFYRAVTPPGGATHIDEAWLDSRFAEIARGIEYSVAHLKPERGFSEFGDRFDQFERQFAKLFAGVATHDDLATVRQVEAHMATMVDHLEKTHDQLDRLNVIEAQLADVSKALADMQATSADAKSAADIDAVARAVAEETAQRFVGWGRGDKNSAAEDLRPLIEQLMSENRRGGEHTAALLDTMKQAMIQLLDRADSIEFAQPAGASAFEADCASTVGSGTGVFGGDGVRDEFGREGAVDMFGDMSRGGFGPDLSVAPPIFSPQYGPDLTADDMVVGSEKLRRELVADARRAKTRLDAESNNPASASMSHAQIRGAASVGSRPIRPPSNAAKKASGPSAPSPRLMVVAAVVLVALAGLWYTTFGFGNRAVPVAVHELPSGQTPQNTSSEAKSAPAATLAPPASAAPAGETYKMAPVPPATNGPRGDLAPAADERGQTTASDDDASRPRTALPMLGVAVDLNQPVSEAEFIQARRHQAMAAMSGELGNAAARPGESAVVPASMVPTEAETEGVAPDNGSAEASNGEAKSSPLDMPAATVGPLSLRLAAANGDSSAQFEVGARFAEGEGVKQNFKEAAKWYQRSADQGFAQAQYRIGTLYERGFGLKADRAQAAVWYQRAAEQGNVKAMHNLAVLCANQTDRAPDYTTAAQWFEEAAKRGLPDSQFNLAVLYENGLGVKRDLRQAFMWLSIAARAGDADATRRREILRGSLTREDVAETQKMMAVWKLTPTDRTVNDALAAGELWKRNPKNGVNG